MVLKAELEKRGVVLSGVRHITEWFKRSYGGDMADESSLLTMIRTNKGYKGLTHPMVKGEDGRWAVQ